MPRLVSRSVRKRRTSLSRRELPVIQDVWGEPWHVAERRPTPYGFAIYMGWAASPKVQYRGGKAGVIVTSPFAKHVRSTAKRPHELPLPIGDNALRRVRKLLGVDHRLWIDTRLNWWLDRIEDLGTLSAARFVAKHRRDAWTRWGSMSTTLVWQMRVALMGRHRRPVGWWRAPEVRALVTSNLSLDEIGERLGISRWTVYGVRQRVLELAASRPIAGRSGTRSPRRPAQRRPAKQGARRGAKRSATKRRTR